MMANTPSSTFEDETMTAADETETTETANVPNADDSQLKAVQDQLLRLQADFDNFRKRVESEKADLYKYGAERTISSLLPVLDNLQRGSASLSETSDPKLLYQSFRMLYTQLMDSLSAQGLQKIDSIGQAFDPFFHEAVQREHSDEQAENNVMMEHQAGYKLHDRVIRPAMVVVSAGPESGEASDSNPFQG